MPRAVGCSQTLFFSKKIGNLCRGKEWWIETEATPRDNSLHRIIVSGVDLQDERARIAKRGLSYSGTSVADFIHLLSQDQNLVAYVDDAFPSQIPNGSSGVEHYQMSRMGFALNSWFARWELTCNSIESLCDAINKGADLFLLNPQAPAKEEKSNFTGNLPAEYGHSTEKTVLNEQLKKDVHRLIGGRQHLNAGARFLADALWDVLENCQAVILLHEDKHSRCLGIYSKESLAFVQQIQLYCERSETLFVPFSIPPMLARWDRAIRDLRREWNEEEQGLFPILVSSGQEEESTFEQESDDFQESDDLQETNIEE